MGGDSSGCSSDAAENTKLAMEKMPSDAAKMCDLLKCMAYCAKTLGCGQDSVKGACEEFKKVDKDCDADCSGVGPAAALSLTAILLAMLQM